MIIINRYYNWKRYKLVYICNYVHYDCNITLIIDNDDDNNDNNNDDNNDE